MSKIISIGNQKGGVGKTQISIMLATALSQAPFNLKTAIIDLDNQKSVVEIRSLDLMAYKIKNAPFEVLDYRLSDLQNNIGGLDKTFDVIILDVAGKLDIDLSFENQEITKILMYVDNLFLPFVAGNHNLTATLKYFQFVKQVQKIRQFEARNLTVRGFINMQRQRSRLNQYLIEDIEILKESQNLEMMQTALNDYALFRESDTFTSIYDPLSNDSAKQNFTAFLNELISIIQ
jgi:cellulose biosynthesis protein BcsQ